MRTILLSLGILFSLLSKQSLGCSQHPGMTHEQWSSAVKDEREKNGSQKVFSDNFFKSSGTGRDTSQETTRERPVRIVR